MTDMCRFAVLVLVYCLMRNARCLSVPKPYTTVINVLKGALAEDAKWYHILNMRIKIPVQDLDANVVAMLQNLNVAVDGTATADGSLRLVENIRVHSVIRRLVTDRGSTGTQLMFGIKVLGTALSCQFVHTVLVHLYFTYAYAYKENTAIRVAAVRACMSTVQVTMARYANKLAVFHQNINHFVKINAMFNEVFSRHDEDENTAMNAFEECLTKIREYIVSTVLAQQCDETDETILARTLRVMNYDDGILEDFTEVDDDHLLSMIHNMDGYEYVNFSSMDYDFWGKRLAITKYVPPINKDLTTDE